jgi:hypothetical protein
MKDRIPYRPITDAEKAHICEIFIKSYEKFRNRAAAENDKKCKKPN